MSLPSNVLMALHAQAEKLRDRPALWSKRQGTYVPTSWREYAHRVRWIALGLRAAGFGRGDVLALRAANREEWLVFALAGMALGGAVVGLDPQTSAERTAAILGHARAKVVVAESAAELERLRTTLSAVPSLTQRYVMSGTRGGEPGARALTFEDVVERGRREQTGLYDDAVAQLGPDTVASLVYPDRHAAPLRGVQLTHRNLVYAGSQVVEMSQATPLDSSSSYLPLSIVGEVVSSLHAPLYSGQQIYFGGSAETPLEHLCEVRPTFVLGTPKVFRTIKSDIEASLALLTGARARAVELARSTALQRNRLALERIRVPPHLKLGYRTLVPATLGPLKTRFGFERARFIASAGGPLGLEVLEFYASLDILIREAYGRSETAGPVTLNIPGATRFGTVGRPLLGVEVEIAEDGEVLLRGPVTSPGYLRDAAATEKLLAGGALHTGDLGELDGHGYLRLTGRK